MSLRFKGKDSSDNTEYLVIAEKGTVTLITDRGVPLALSNCFGRRTAEFMFVCEDAMNSQMSTHERAATILRSANELGSPRDWEFLG